MYPILQAVRGTQKQYVVPKNKVFKHSSTTLLKGVIWLSSIMASNIQGMADPGETRSTQTVTERTNLEIKSM